MSTNSKDLNPLKLSEAMITKSKRSIDRQVSNFLQDSGHENTLLQETPTGRLQKVLRIYRATKPLFTVVSTLPLIPSMWRAAIVMLLQALEALAEVGPDITADFKAGKDI